MACSTCVTEKPIPSRWWSSPTKPIPPRRPFQPRADPTEPSETEALRRDDDGVILDAIGGAEHWEVVPAAVTLSEQERQLWQRDFSGAMPDLSIDDRRDLPPDPRRYRGRRRPQPSLTSPHTP